MVRAVVVVFLEDCESENSQWFEALSAATAEIGRAIRPFDVKVAEARVYSDHNESILVAADDIGRRLTAWWVRSQPKEGD